MIIALAIVPLIATLIAVATPAKEVRNYTKMPKPEPKVACCWRWAESRRIDAWAKLGECTEAPEFKAANPTYETCELVLRDWGRVQAGYLYNEDGTPKSQAQIDREIPTPGIYGALPTGHN